MGFLCFSGMARIMKAKSLVVKVMCRRGLNFVCPLFAVLPQRGGSGRK